MNVVNVKKNCLNEMGYKNFEEWSLNPNHLYIGRNMSYYVKGAFRSKWANPFTAKKYGTVQCITLYEQYIRDSGLFDDLDELNCKILGCWCKPNECHGDILIKLYKEKKHLESKKN
jgi:hypothetical protein